MKEGKLKKSNALKFFVAIFIAVFVFYNIQIVNVTNAGVPKILSFQGRLTNASGNLLGSSGTNYYFKFGIFNAVSGGTQLWPSTTIASSATITSRVTQGVFNALLGDTTAGFEAISLDFDSSDYYLEIRVSELGSTFETLTPRQRIVASGFAVNADTVHGGRFINATGVGQFGGLATLSYSRFGTAITDHSLTSASDVLISGILEVDGHMFFDGGASVSGSFELTSALSKLGINAGAVTDTMLEVGGTASISGTLTLAGILTGSNTGSNSFAGSLDITKGLRFSNLTQTGTTLNQLAGKLNVLQATANPQLRVGQSNSVYSEFYIDGAGDVVISATGGNIRHNEENLWVCSGGGCDPTAAPIDTGNIIVEKSVIFDNKFKFKQIDTSTVRMYDSIGSATLQFDEGQ